MRTATKNFTFVAEYQPEKKVSVYEQYLSPDDYQNDTFYPLVTVELQSVTDTETDSIAVVGLTIGVFGGENSPAGDGREIEEGKFADYGDGWRDLLNLSECIRQHLLTHRLIGDQFRLVLPVRFETLAADLQPLPFFIAGMTLQYHIAQPQETLPIPDDIQQVTGNRTRGAN